MQANVQANFCGETGGIFRRDLPDFIALNLNLNHIHPHRMPAAEVQGIRKVDMDYERQAVRVVGKGRKPRLLTLSGPMQQAWDALQRQLVECPRTDDFIWPQYSGWARKALEKIGRVALGPDIRCDPHKFRHTWATQALSGWDDP